MSVGRVINVAELVDGILKGSRGALSQSITLIESDRREHRELANALLSTLLKRRAELDEAAAPSSAHAKTAPETTAATANRTGFRIAVTGPPGAGKSSLIEALGMHLVGNTNTTNTNSSGSGSSAASSRLAVLAVDPSSKLSGGSILGDKTRMNELARMENAYVRPSASRGALGGVARHTAETIELVEAAGYSQVLVETVGVGQSETMVSEITDMMILVVNPGAGDELQGIKRGIMELADLIVVNKCDGDLEPQARHTQADYTRALQLMPRRHRSWVPYALGVSALTRLNIPKLADAIAEFQSTLRRTGEFAEQRTHQRLKAFDNDVQMRIEQLVRSTPQYIAGVTDLRHLKTTPWLASEAVLNALFPKQ